jgi:hypothetical protein
MDAVISGFAIFLAAAIAMAAWGRIRGIGTMRCVTSGVGPAPARIIRSLRTAVAGVASSAASATSSVSCVP